MVTWFVNECVRLVRQFGSIAVEGERVNKCAMDEIRRQPHLLDCVVGSKAVCSIALVWDLIPTSVCVQQKTQARSAPEALAHPMPAAHVPGSTCYQLHEFPMAPLRQ